MMFGILLNLLLLVKTYSWSNDMYIRRCVLDKLLVVSTTLLPGISENSDVFTSAYGKEEYTNSITASKDTNISPKEVYDSIQGSYLQYPLEQLRAKGLNREARAWDVGAGAGVSTQTLYNMGYKFIDAVDWSDTAWNENVIEGKLPKTVHFQAIDDESFYIDVWKPNHMDKFDVIVFNFAINERKAKNYAREMLQEETGRLFAPVNTQSDYWLKQSFRVYDANGNILWNVSDIGAWSVQFQPDVTQETCQGIWCPPFNGFKKRSK